MGPALRLWRASTLASISIVATPVPSGISTTSQTGVDWYGDGAGVGAAGAVGGYNFLTVIYKGYINLQAPQFGPLSSPRMIGTNPNWGLFAGTLSAQQYQ